MIRRPRKFVSVVAYHGYDFKNFDKIAELEKKYPDLTFWMDELCYAYEAVIPRTKSCRSTISTTAMSGAILFSAIWKPAHPLGCIGCHSG